MGTFLFTFSEKSILEILGSLVGLSLSDINKYLSLVKTGLGVVEILEKLFLKVSLHRFYLIKDYIKVCFPEVFYNMNFSGIKH